MNGYRGDQDLHLLHRDASREGLLAATASSGAGDRGVHRDASGTLRTAPLRASGATSRGARAYLASLQRLGADPEVLDEARRGWPAERRRRAR